MTQCVHHWLIESPNGPVAEGVCQKCGERRNYVTGDPLDYRELPMGLASLGHPSYYYKNRPRDARLGKSAP